MHSAKTFILHAIISLFLFTIGMYVLIEKK